MLAGSDDVGHGAAGQGSVQGAGDDADFGRSAAHTSGDGSRESEEEVAAARRVEDLPEQYEHEHVGTGHADRGAEDAVVGVDHAVKEDFHRGAAMSEIAWQVFAHEVVDDEHEDDPEQHRAHRAPRDFQRQQHEGRRDHPVGGRQGVDAGPAGDEFRPVHHHVGSRREAYTGKQDVGHGDVLGLSGLGTDRGVADERQRYRERDEQRAQDERVNEPERRSIQFHRRKKDDEHADDPAP